MKKLMLVVVLVLLVSAVSFAQSSTAPVQITNATCLSASGSAAYVAPLGGTPAGSTLESVCILKSYSTYTVDTQAVFGSACSAVKVYRVTAEGSQDVFAVDGRSFSCAGNSMTVQSVGAGHYVFYSFGSSDAANAAPKQLKAGKL